MSIFEAVIFDADDVLFASRNEVDLITYNLYLQHINLSNDLVLNINDVPDEMLKKIKEVGKFNTRGYHRLCTYYCIDNGIMPNSRDDFRDILDMFSREQKEIMQNSVDEIRMRIKSDADRYEQIAPPFEGIKDLICDLVGCYDVFVATSNKMAAPRVARHFPMISSDSIYVETGASKAASVKQILRKKAYSRVHFIDDAMQNVIDVVTDAGLEGVVGYVNDWGGRFTRTDLEADPDYNLYSDRIKIVNLDQFRRVLLLNKSFQ